MSIEWVTVLMLSLFFTLLILGVPMAFMIYGIAIIISLILYDPNILMLGMVRTFSVMNNYIFVAAPMFIFMGCLLQESGCIEQLFDTLYLWFGPVRGGLAIATVICCTIMAAMTGIMGSTVVLMGLVALPQMLKRGYNKTIALGSIMAGGSLGVLIPPSVTFVVYGAMLNVSVTDLFAGGMMPGLLLSGLFVAYIVTISLINPRLCPAMSEEERTVPLRQKIVRAKYIVLPGLLILLVLGSIYLGIATPTEAAGVGCAGTVAIAAIHRRFSWKMVKNSALTTMKSTGMIIWIIFAAFYLVGIYSKAGGADYIEKTMLGLGLSGWGIVIVTQLVIIILGMFIDWIGILLLVMPFAHAMAVKMGFDPVWFGVLFVMNTQIAYLSPPFASAIFFLKGVAPKDVTMADMYRSVWPFMGLQVLGMIIVMIFPQIALWLPHLLYGSQ